MESSASAGRAASAVLGYSALKPGISPAVLTQVSVHGSYFPGIVTTVAVSRSQHCLAAHKGANPLAALTEGCQPASLVCAAPAGTGPALAFLLPGRPRKPAHELPEPDPATDAGAGADVVIRPGTKRANSPPVPTAHAARGGDSRQHRSGGGADHDQPRIPHQSRPG